MDDQEILQRISDLVGEEHTLEEAHRGEGIDPDKVDRLQKIEVALDQCWDLLRRRRARRSAGLDPEEVSVRDADTVERYQQ